MSRLPLWILVATWTVVSLALAPQPVEAQSGPTFRLTVAGDGSSPAAPRGTLNVLWEQTSSGTGGVASQHLPDYGTGFYSADDFQNTEPWSVAVIFVDGAWNGVGSLPDADSLNWVVYADAGGVPAGHPEDGGGTEFWSCSAAPGAPGVVLGGDNSDTATLTLSPTCTPLDLPPGHWWLVFYPSLNFTLYDQWYWDRAGTANLVDAHLIDPSDLFASGWTAWTSWYDVVDPGGTYDLAFRLEGLVVPVELQLFAVE